MHEQRPVPETESSQFRPIFCASSVLQGCLHSEALKNFLLAWVASSRGTRSRTLCATIPELDRIQVARCTFSFTFSPSMIENRLPGKQRIPSGKGFSFDLSIRPSATGSWLEQICLARRSMALVIINSGTLRDAVGLVCILHQYQPGKCRSAFPKAAREGPVEFSFPDRANILTSLWVISVHMTDWLQPPTCDSEIPRLAKASYLQPKTGD